MLFLENKSDVKRRLQSMHSCIIKTGVQQASWKDFYNCDLTEVATDFYYSDAHLKKLFSEKEKKMLNRDAVVSIVDWMKAGVIQSSQSIVRKGCGLIALN